MQPNALRIGITIGLHQENESLWTNGIKQNAAFLAEALKFCPSVASVKLVNTTAVNVSSALPWDLERWPTVTFEAAKDALDVLIELGGQINAAQTAYLKLRGTRVVSYCCGVEYIQGMESILFNRPLWGSGLFITQRYDAVWMVPQVANSSADFFSTFRRRPTQVVPFVWSPFFLEERAAGFAHGGAYRPQSKEPKRLTIMEPNNDVVKFCMYPILIAEQAFRQAPQSVGFLHVTNSEHLATTSPEFIALMHMLDIVKQGKVAFVGRFDTPHFLSEFTDVVISHQWDNPLNYFYFDVCWQGYPLIHNAHMCAELGYYYEGNNVTAGRDALLQAINQHDSAWETYTAQQRQLLAKYLPGNPALTTKYDILLRTLCAQPIT